MKKERVKRVMRSIGVNKIVFEKFGVGQVSALLIWCLVNSNHGLVKSLFLVAQAFVQNVVCVSNTKAKCTNFIFSSVILV